MADRRRARQFFLERREDPSGISGTGLVAWGIESPYTGQVALEWLTPIAGASLCYYPSVAMVERIHGHGSKTVVRWAE